MKQFFLRFVFAALLLPNFLHAADPNKFSGRNTVKKYVKQWAPTAVKNMREFGIPASIILAQGILESGYGNSQMAREANNHFGIKCLGWDGESYYTQGDGACFRAYPSSVDCFDDHARIIRSKQRYRFLFRFDPRDYRSWARGLKRAGYASNTEYDRLLIRTIEAYKLYEYDLGQVGRWSDKSGYQQSAVRPVKKLSYEFLERIEPDELPGENYEPEVKMHSIDPVEAGLVNVAPKVKLRYVVALKGMRYSDIAAKEQIPLKDILQFNDLSTDAQVPLGHVVYLESKLSEAPYFTHTLRQGQNLWQVSQYYGIKLESLRKFNRIRSEEEVVAGTALKLALY